MRMLSLLERLKRELGEDNTKYLCEREGVYVCVRVHVRACVCVRVHVRVCGEGVGVGVCE